MLLPLLLPLLLLLWQLHAPNVADRRQRKEASFNNGLTHYCPKHSTGWLTRCVVSVSVSVPPESDAIY